MVIYGLTFFSCLKSLARRVSKELSLVVTKSFSHDIFLEGERVVAVEDLEEKGPR
jgi:hypothetical protein